MDSDAGFVQAAPEDPDGISGAGRNLKEGCATMTMLQHLLIPSEFRQGADFDDAPDASGSRQCFGSGSDREGGDELRSVVEIQHPLLHVDKDTPEFELGVVGDLLLLDLLDLEGNDIGNADDVADFQCLKIFSVIELFQEVGRGMKPFLQKDQKGRINHALQLGLFGWFGRAGSDHRRVLPADGVVRVDREDTIQGKLLVDADVRSKMMGPGIVEKGLGCEFAPLSINDSRAEILFIEENLEPRDQFRGVHRLGMGCLAWGR